MTGIVFATAMAGETERLTGVAASDAIHDATPRASVEGSQVTPDRCRSQATLLHLRRQSGDGERFPLHHADCASPSEARSSSSSVEAEIEAATSAAQADGT